MEQLLALSRAAQDLQEAGEQEGAQLLLDRLLLQLRELSPEQAVLLTRMCSSYLNLSGIAETQHMCARPSPPEY